MGQVTSYADLVGPGAETDDAVRESLDEVFDSPRGIYAGGLISQDYQRANVQVSMKRGDNKSMQRVLDEADAFWRPGLSQPGLLPTGLERPT